MNYLRYILFSFIVLTGCTDSGYIPKPQAYPRIEFPKHREYRYSSTDCPFQFKYPGYAQVIKDTGRTAEPCWMNVYFPEFNARIHLSYKPVTSFKNFFEMSEDARMFAYKHAVKAEDISEFYYRYSKDLSGVLYTIEGNTASSLQFYATDSVNHYLRGALYFYAKPNKDSLQPVVNFIRTDIDTLIKSIRWK